MHDSSWKTPDCTTGGVRVVAQQSFISSRRKRGGGGGGQKGEINRDMLNYVRGVNNNLVVHCCFYVLLPM